MLPPPGCAPPTPTASARRRRCAATTSTGASTPTSCRSASAAATRRAPSASSASSWPTCRATRRSAGPRRGGARPAACRPSRSACCCSWRSPRPWAPRRTGTPGRCRSSPRCSSCGSPAGAARTGASVSESGGLPLAQRLAASLTALLVVSQFFLAGAGAFGATSFDLHRTVGSAAIVVALLGLALAALNRRHVGHSAAVAGLLVLQLVLGVLGGDEPWIGALHGLNAIAVMGAAGRLAQANWEPV